MSQSTEQDLLAIAELLSPTVDASAEESDTPVSETAPVSELEPVPDMFFDEVSATTSVRDSMSSSMSSIYSSYHRPSSASVRSSIYTDSDGASLMGDDLPDPALLYSIHGHALHGGFHLPSRNSLSVPPLDDNRSLSSATSYSSLRTPSLSRHSSVQFLNSPPVSPTSSYLPTPVDGPPGGASPQPPNSKGLDVIEEARYGEDQELRRVPSDDAQTIHGWHDPSDPQFTPVEPFLMRKPEPRHPPSQQRRLPELEKLRINTQTPDVPPSPASRYGQHSAHPAPMPASPVLSELRKAAAVQHPSGSTLAKPTPLTELIDQYMKRAGHVMESALPYESRPGAERRVQFSDAVNKTGSSDVSSADEALVMVAHAVQDSKSKEHKVAYSSGFVVHPPGTPEGEAVLVTCAHTLEEIRHNPIIRPGLPSPAVRPGDVISGSYIINGPPKAPVFHPVASM
ncbi:hypothetical protein NUW54_g7208 [Trametes sanguinea]|uniref:Uncharacterized protein n=1 Tax=Trametes sanguinea TaxID=158606 RepID=A0ACC1PNI8_9APHY|nr:hypothetical protein NUW54_g7208 [Trametes sanguinea]